MNISRRAFGSAALGLAAAATSASAQMVIRRVPKPGEDPLFFDLGQDGPFAPIAKPVIVPFEHARTVVFAPQNNPRPAPLIVFSHAALTDPLVYRQLLFHLSTHGYCVAAPVHDDSVFERGLLARRAEAQGSSVWEIDRVLNDSIAWEQRIQACQRPIDHPDLLMRTVGVKIDFTRPIIMGHEFGALVAQMMMGASVKDEQGKVRDFRDDRWFSACLLSPQGAGVMGLGQDSWSACAKPIMVVQPANESDFTRQKPQDKIAPFNRSPAGYKHLAWFNQGTRDMFAGPRAGTASSEVLNFDDTKAVVTTFVRAYADYDQDVFSKLTTDWIERATLGRVSVRYR